MTNSIIFADELYTYIYILSLKYSINLADMPGIV